MEHLLEYAGVASGLLYLWLEIRQRRAMWVVGFITSAVYVVVFVQAKIYADAALNAYYVAISLYGFRQWSRARFEKASSCQSPLSSSSSFDALPDTSHADTSSGQAVPPEKTIFYHRLTFRMAGKLLLILALLYAFIYFLLARYTDSPIPAGDAFTTATGIVATWMLARRILEHWWLWIVADAFSIYLYYVRDLYPTMLLYFCYTLLAAAGLYTWKKKGVNIYGKTI